MQCDSPACVAACPTGASYKQDDGVTLVDYDACICCGQCVAACPYGARHINNQSKYWFEQNTPAPYEAEGVQRSNVAEKCIFCANLVAEGGTPACVATCPGKARVFGDIEDLESDIAKKAANAIRIDETGCYYIPVKGMSDELIAPVVTSGSALPIAKKVEAKKAEANPTPLIVGGAVVAAAAVGAAVGVGVSKAKANKSESKGEIKSESKSENKGESKVADEKFVKQANKKADEKNEGGDK
jgi:molybdopterin-containing oxidoreductase family iron-sulfur binding subunit